MTMLSKQKNRKNILYTIPVLLVFFVLLFFIGKAAWNTYGKMTQSSERRQQAEAELAELESRYDALSEKVEYLETEKGIEEEIRTKFNVAKEGEKVFVIVGEDEGAGDEVKVERGIFGRIWGRLFN